VRILGIDDWSWKKGQIYGTLLVDLFLRVFVKRQFFPPNLACEARCYPSVLDSQKILQLNMPAICFLISSEARAPLFAGMSEIAQEKPDAQPVVSPNEQ